MSSNIWDKLRFRPICYLPPIWEIFLALNITPDQLKDIVNSDTRLAPEATATYFKKRITVLNNLIKTGKIDAKIGKIATDHFNTHLQELEALRMK